MMMRSFGALGLLFAATPARAAEPLPPITARLEYTRPSGCPAESDLHYEVARRLGKDPFVKEGLFRVVATIARQKNKVIGDLAIYDGEGQTVAEKHLSYPPWDCAGLLEVFAISLSLHLDPEPLPPAPVKAPPAPPAALPPPSPPVPPAPLPPPKEEAPPVQAKPPAAVPIKLRGVVGLGGQVAFGSVGQAASLVGHLGVRWPVLSPEVAFSLGAEFRYDLPTSALVEERPGVRVRQKFLVGGSLVSCLHWRALFGCALASGGMVSIASTGFDDPDAASPALGYVRAGARFGVETPLLPRLALRFSGEGLVALRPLYVANRDVDLRTPVLSFPLSGSVAASLVFFFGGAR
jgi:hypothetical protein